MTAKLVEVGSMSYSEVGLDKILNNADIERPTHVAATLFDFLTKIRRHNTVDLLT